MNSLNGHNLYINEYTRDLASGVMISQQEQNIEAAMRFSFGSPSGFF